MSPQAARQLCMLATQCCDSKRVTAEVPGLFIMVSFDSLTSSGLMKARQVTPARPFLSVMWNEHNTEDGGAADVRIKALWDKFVILSYFNEFSNVKYCKGIDILNGTYCAFCHVNLWMYVTNVPSKSNTACSERFVCNITATSCLWWHKIVCTYPQTAVRSIAFVAKIVFAVFKLSTHTSPDSGSYMYRCIWEEGK